MEREKMYDRTLLIGNGDTDAIRLAGEHLKAGGTVAFPTETVYGLGANAFDAEAVRKIFKAKGRPGDNPLICHIADKSQIDDCVSEITPLAAKLIDAFMPGPITIIMHKSENIPYEVTAGLDTVGVRMPSDRTANEFLRYCAVPVAAPSANLSGSPSPTNAQSVLEDMDGYTYAVIDGGDSVFGLESTVVDCTGESPVILRPGAVTEAAIELAANVRPAIAGTCEAGSVPKAPGMKYRHYAPVSQVEIVDMPENFTLTNDEFTGDLTSVTCVTSEDVDFSSLDEAQKQALVDIATPYVTRVQELLKQKPLIRIGIYCGTEVRQLIGRLNDRIFNAHINIYEYGRAGNVRAASHGLFEGLRHLDMQEVDIILAQGLDGRGLSRAYMNRLTKASGKTGELAPGMPRPARPARHVLPLEAFRDTVTQSILFVCDDNTCLSPAMEAIMRGILDSQAPYRLEGHKDIGCEIYCESAGLTAQDGLSPDPVMTRCVRSICRTNMSSHTSLRAVPSVYDANDLIITMKDEQAFSIVSAFPQINDKVYSLSTFAAANGIVFRSEKGEVASISVPDPGGENESTYAHTAAALKAWLELIFPYILKAVGAERC